MTIQAREIHRVAPDESLAFIAEKYGLTVDDLILGNNLHNPDNINVGQVIIIPNMERPDIYRVQTGDTLDLIADKLSIPVAVLVKENSLISLEELYINKPILIPRRYRFPQIYTVKAGDTIYNIANKFNISTEEIIMLNKLTDSSIYTGQSLRIPVLKKSEYSITYPDILYYNGIADGRKIALTFDDGPDPFYTEKVLEILQEHEIPATFFVVGNNVQVYPELTKKIVEDGHLIANHSWSHANLTKLDSNELEFQIKETEMIVETLTGVKMRFIRPPWGFVTENILELARTMDYKIINWDVDSEDWNDNSIDQILLNTIPNTKENSILLFHSAGGKKQSLDNTISVLPELITTLKSNGYTFVTIAELINTEAYKQ